MVEFSERSINLITKRLKNIIQNSDQYDLYTFYDIIINSFLKEPNRNADR